MSEQVCCIHTNGIPKSIMSRSVKVLALIISQGINAVVAILFLPYLSRALSVVEYGTYGQTILITNIATVLLACGLGKVIYTFYADSTKVPGDVFKSNIATAITLGVVGAIIGILGADIIGLYFNNPDTTPLIRIHLLALPMLVSYFTLNATLIYFDHVKTSAQIAVVTNLLKVGFLLVSIQILDSIMWVFISLVFVACIQFLWAFLYVNKKVDLKGGVFSKKLALEQLWVGVPLGLTAIIGVIYKSTDSIMISNMLSVEDYAIYRNGAFEVPFIATLYGSIGAIVLPDVARLWNSKRNVDILELKKDVISNTFSIICPIFLVITVYFSNIITTYLSSVYQASGIIFLIFSISLLIRVTSYEDVLIVSKKNVFILKVYLFSFLFNLALNYVLINELGRVGAAISTIITLIMIASILLWKTSRLLGATVIDFFDLPKLLKIVLISVIVFIPIVYLEYVLSIYFLLAIGFYLALVYFIIIRNGLLDRRITTKLLDKIPFGNYLFGNILKLNK